MRTTTGSLFRKDTLWKVSLKSPWESMLCFNIFRNCCQVRLLWLLRQGTRGLTARSWSYHGVAGKSIIRIWHFLLIVLVLEWTFWLEVWNWVCRYEFQMQYGSIGWSVGATLGYAQAVPEKRVIACIGDGSFQVIIDLFSLLNLPKWVKSITTTLVLDIQKLVTTFLE